MIWCNSRADRTVGIKVSHRLIVHWTKRILVIQYVMTNKLIPGRGFFMFTGIITHLGQLKKIDGALFTFKAPESFCKHLGKGESVAVNGVCLTVLGKKEDNFAVEIMPETAKKTMLGKLRKDDLVNLELPVSTQTLLSGHIVYGHIDGVGKILNISSQGNSKILTITYDKQIGKYIVEKGSIALNGISLTIISIKPAKFSVGIIPHTLKSTMLSQIKIGDLVNIEVDILAKYLEKLIKKN